MKHKPKLLYVASTQSHLENFHKPYIKALMKKYEVLTMATGESVDLPVVFDKHFFSLKNLRSILHIRKILRRERFDAIILHTTLAAFLVRAAMIGMRHRPYVMNVVHGYLFGETLQGLKDRILLFCERLMRRRTDDIAVMNREDERIATKHRLCRGCVYFIKGMGVSVEGDAGVPDPLLRAKYGDEKDFVCFFIGELSGRKNQVFLIRAVKRLREEGLPIRLLLAGEGSERENLETTVKELGLERSVQLLGSVSPVTPYLLISDLYVSASVSEGLPFNIMEAMWCGLPIVASNVKGQSDLLEHYPQTLYPLNDEDAFCDAVRRAYCAQTRGAGSQRYPTLEEYRLSAVFEANMKIFSSAIPKKESNER